MEPDRLPFGRHSMLLDPVTLKPLCDLNLSQTIRTASEHRVLHSVRTTNSSANPIDTSAEEIPGGFDEVLWTVLGFDGIAKRFTQHQALRIAQEMKTSEQRSVDEKRDLAVV